MFKEVSDRPFRLGTPVIVPEPSSMVPISRASAIGSSIAAKPWPIQETRNIATHLVRLCDWMPILRYSIARFRPIAPAPAICMPDNADKCAKEAGIGQLCCRIFIRLLIGMM